MNDVSKISALTKVEEFAKSYMGEYTSRPYHNFNHVLEVREDCILLAQGEGLNPHQKFLLETAALTHDLINNFGSPKKSAKTDEEITSGFVGNVLPDLGYSGNDTRIVMDLIRSTNFKVKPKGILEKIIKDADVANVGKPSFMEKGELIRLELGVPENLEWYIHQKNFLESHHFFTDTARKYWNDEKEKNKELVLEKISSFYK